MNRTPRFLLAAFLLGTIPFSAVAQEPIKLARTPDISPDGKLVAFSYLGDIWVVEAIGGVARPVTIHRAHDINPVFSPDGKWIAFSSNRHGSYNVFVIPVQSGKPRRLDFRFRQRVGHRLVARRQERSSSPRRATPTSRSASNCTPSRSRAAGLSGSPRPRAAKASFRPTANGSPMSAVRAPGIARAIAARPTTTSGSATPTAPTTAS